MASFEDNTLSGSRKESEISNRTSRLNQKYQQQARQMLNLKATRKTLKTHENSYFEPNFDSQDDYSPEQHLTRDNLTANALGLD
jgi:hypothetical protein